MRSSAARRAAGDEELPVRPSIPITVIGATCSWAACIAVGEFFASGASDWNAGGIPTVWLTGAVFVVSLLVVGTVNKRTRMISAVCLIGLMSGMVSSCLYYSGLQQRVAGALSSEIESAVFYVEGDLRQTKTGNWYFQATAFANSGAEPVGAVVYVDGNVLDRSPMPHLGEKVVMTGSWGRFDLAEDYGRSQYLQGRPVKVSAASLRVVGREEGVLGLVRGWRGSLLGILDPQTSAADALLAGVVCGNQAAVANSGLSDCFSDLGISHLVAVSGSHLAVVAGLAMSLGTRMRVTPRRRLAPVLCLLLLYVCFTGVQISAVRSYIMAAAAMLGTSLGRRSQGAASVGVAAMVLLLCEPGCAWSMGFQLSVLSVLSLALFSSYVRAWVAVGLPSGTPRAVVDCLAISATTISATLPVTLPAFGTLSLVSPLANLVMGPLVSLILPLGLVVLPVALIFPALSFVAVVPRALAGVAMCFATTLSQFPYCSLAVEARLAVLMPICAAAFAIMYLAWPRPSRKVFVTLTALLIAAAIGFILKWRFFAPARVVVMDVGQGDAILVQEGSSTMLVDVGPDSSVVDALGRLHVFHVDAVVITHTDLDHIGGFAALESDIGFDHIVAARGVRNASGDALSELFGRHDVFEVVAGDTVAFGGWSASVVWPRSSVRGDENEDSIVMALEYSGVSGDGFGMLLTGDAEREVLEPLAMTGVLPTVDVLKVGHHGSSGSVTDYLMEYLDCRLAVASAGKNNLYGHPKKEVVECVGRAGAEFLCTKEAGDIEIYPVSGGVRVICQVPGS